MPFLDSVDMKSVFHFSSCTLCSILLQWNGILETVQSCQLQTLRSIFFNLHCITPTLPVTVVLPRWKILYFFFLYPLHYNKEIYCILDLKSDGEVTKC